MSLAALKVDPATPLGEVWGRKVKCARAKAICEAVEEILSRRKVSFDMFRSIPLGQLDGFILALRSRSQKPLAGKHYWGAFLDCASEGVYDMDAIKALAHPAIEAEIQKRDAAHQANKAKQAAAKETEQPDTAPPVGGADPAAVARVLGRLNESAATAVPDVKPARVRDRSVPAQIKRQAEAEQTGRLILSDPTVRPAPPTRLYGAARGCPIVETRRQSRNLHRGAIRCGQ